jgi:ankyrin repeat protein
MGYAQDTGSALNPPHVDQQLVREFLTIVHQGNYQAIINFINKYNLDVKQILDGNFRHTCLYYAVLIQNPEVAYLVMKAFIEKGVPPAYTDILNQTVLYYAAREGKLKCAEYLISLGCNVNHRDQYGQTPLYYAAREGHYEVVNKLIQAGSNVNNVDANGQTALFYAAREGKRDVCELLINFGININKQDNQRQTALCWAKKYNRPDLVSLLLSHGAIPTKELAPPKPKEKIKKTEKGKKAPTDINAIKHFVLTVYKDGGWRELTPAEFQEFIATNKEVGKYFTNPSLLQSIKPSAAEEAANVSYHWDKVAGKILNHLWKQHGAWHFHRPVDYVAMKIPDYPELIKHPMDFGTIKERLATGCYKNRKEFIDDVELVFSNCILYNKETSEFGILAKRIRDEFHAQCASNSLDYYVS